MADPHLTTNWPLVLVLTVPLSCLVRLDCALLLLLLWSLGAALALPFLFLFHLKIKRKCIGPSVCID